MKKQPFQILWLFCHNVHSRNGPISELGRNLIDDYVSISGVIEVIARGGRTAFYHENKNKQFFRSKLIYHLINWYRKHIYKQFIFQSYYSWLQNYFVEHALEMYRNHTICQHRKIRLNSYLTNTTATVFTSRLSTRTKHFFFFFLPHFQQSRGGFRTSDKVYIFDKKKGKLIF